MGEHYGMTYEECLRSTFLYFQSWALVLVGLAVALAFRAFGKTYKAIGAVIVGAALGLIWAVGYYEMNCVELYL
jgi:hypothetical protein